MKLEQALAAAIFGSKLALALFATVLVIDLANDDQQRFEVVLSWVVVQQLLFVESLAQHGFLAALKRKVIKAFGTYSAYRSLNATTCA